MRYLISEVEFFIPTVEEYKDHVVVIRRDQLEGEKLYVAPKDLVFASAQFATDADEPKTIEHFADFVLFSANTKGLEVNFDPKNRDSIGFYDSAEDVSATIVSVENKFLILVEKETTNIRILRDFINGTLGEEAYVLVSNPGEEEKMVNSEVSEEEQNSIVEESNKEE